MENNDWMETKKRHLNYWESVWLYAWKVDHESYQSIMTWDGAISDGSTKFALNFYWLKEDIW